MDAGFLVKDERPLLLHATLVNTIYVPGVRGSRGDARDVLGRYEDTVWGRGRVEKVVICRMGAKKRQDGSEAYVVEGEVYVW